MALITSGCGGSEMQWHAVVNVEPTIAIIKNNVPTKRTAR